MKTKRHFCKTRTIKKSQILVLGLFLVAFLTVFFFIKFNQKITPKLLRVAEASIDKLNETIITNFKVKDMYPMVDLANAILLTKNAKDEIISVDFDLETVYKSLSLITEYLQRSVEDVGVRQKILSYYNDEISSELDRIVLTIPIGVASDSLYLNNLGPRIPVSISYMGYVSSSVRIKLEDYGINNVLISIFIDCSLTNKFIVPSIEKDINHSYSILVASKIIQGVVPEYYGGAIETKSSILNVPIS